MIKAVIFDCFGVLMLGSGLTGIVEELEKTNPEAAKQIRDITVRAHNNQVDAQTARETTANLLGLTGPAYAEKIKQSEIKNQELLNYVLTLRPKYKTAVLSNVLSGGLTVRFPEAEARRYFDVMVESGTVGYAKPEPEAYEITAERLGVRLDECIMVDDRESYCAGARAVGMQAILYTSLEQCRNELSALLS